MKSYASLNSRVVGLFVCFFFSLKPALKCSHESVMGTLTGVAGNALSTRVSFCFTWLLSGSLKGTRNFVMVLY